MGSSKRARSSLTSTTAESSSRMSTTDPRLSRKLLENRVHTHEPHLPKPHDLGDIVEQLDRSRRSASPSEKEYKEFCSTLQYSTNEETTKPTWDNYLAYKVGSRGPETYQAHYNVNWNGVDNHITQGIANAKPDYAECLQRLDFSDTATISMPGLLPNASASLSMPSMCVEIKGPGGNMAIARNQCAYDGALMLNNTHNIYKFAKNQNGDFFGKTHALCIAYNGSEVRYYSTHSSIEKRSDNDRQFYYQNEVVMDSPTLSFESFKLARKHARNCQDWALVKATSLAKDLQSLESPPSENWNVIAHEWNAPVPKYSDKKPRCNPTPSTS